MAPSSPYLKPVPVNIPHGGLQRTLQLRHCNSVGKESSRDKQGLNVQGRSKKEATKCMQEETKLGNGKTDK